MKFLTKTWIQTQFSNFAARIALIFAKKAETNEHFTQKSTQSILGHVKLSNSAAVTIAGEYALDAVEKNASVEGTLANMISQANSNLEWKESPMDIPFIGINQELTIDAENFFNDFYNDVCIIIGVDTLSKTNTLVNVSLPIVPLGFQYNGDDDNRYYGGEAYRYENKIKIILRSISGINIGDLRVKSVLYKQNIFI